MLLDIYFSLNFCKRHRVYRVTHNSYRYFYSFHFVQKYSSLWTDLIYFALRTWFVPIKHTVTFSYHFIKLYLLSTYDRSGLNWAGCNLLGFFRQMEHFLIDMSYRIEHQYEPKRPQSGGNLGSFWCSTRLWANTGTD